MNIIVDGLTIDEEPDLERLRRPTFTGRPLSGRGPSTPGPLKPGWPNETTHHTHWAAGRLEPGKRGYCHGFPIPLKPP